MMYRYDKTAIWHKHITSSDNEQIRPAVKGVEFRCFEQTLKTKGPAQILEGASGQTAAVTLQTDNPIAFQSTHPHGVRLLILFQAI